MTAEKSLSFFILKIFFFLCCLFGFTACGLDEFYELDPPVRCNNQPDSNTEYATRYFEFTTNETGENNKNYIDSSSSFKFLGTAIYYKIYNNLSTMDSDITTISTLINSTNYSNAVSRIRETLSYQELGTVKIENSQRREISTNPLISAQGKNRTVYIRLTNYQDTKEFSARILIDKEPLKDGDFELYPSRSGSNKSFDFGRTEDDKEVNVEPSQGDVDFASGTFTEPDNKKYYVNMYAIAVGRDTTYTNYYSNALHLGSVSITATEEDN